MVIALPADADVLNPILWGGSSTGTVLQFLFADLTTQRFDSTQGLVVDEPGLARSWEWSEDGRQLTIHLRSDARWSDGVPFTSEDIRFAYSLYGQPKSGTARTTSLVHLPRMATGALDVDQAISIPDDSTAVFHFLRSYERHQQLNHAGLYSVPRHVLGETDPDSLRSSPYNVNPVSAGHYVLKKWIRKQEIELARRGDWSIPRPAHVDRIVFRILPDMSTRLIELKTGGVDVVEGLSPDEADEIERSDLDIRIERQSHRRFDFAGWNHIDAEVYRRSGGRTIRPHPIFGDRRVRRALTMAINRRELLVGWLGAYGQLCEGPVSPALRWAYNDTLTPMPFAPDSARRILADAGWEDHDGDGILDRKGQRLEFTLVTNVGNPRREFAVQKIQSDLQKIGIQCRTRLLETNQFNAGLRKREFEAFVAGLSTNLQADLQNQLGSDLERSVLNYSGYRNPVVDSLLNAASSKTELIEAGSALKKIQAILMEDQPLTYLFWFDNIVAINNRVKGTHVSILSVYERFYDWHVAAQP